MDALGIDLKLIIAQLVNFGILFFLLSKFAYKPILKMLEDRQSKIDQGLTDAEKAATELAKSEEEAEKIREKAFREANDILRNAKDSASLESAELIKKASDQADRTIKAAKDEAASAKDKVMSEAKKEVADIVIIALDKIVSKELTTEQKKNLTSKAISEL
ncbi:MAG: F0F1 ATP synthase subunit B [Candidatus Berkelbacteria bacterium]|nr:F0F1 ATP synthase subunit B [Candidatus Berkelbacteria bacterium]